MKLKRILAAALAAATVVLTAAAVSADSIFDAAKNIDSGKFEASFKYPSGEQEPTALMTLNLKKGDTVQLGANGDKPSWKSSDKSTASVSKSGFVTAVKKGKAVITLTCGSKTQTIEIIVE